MSVRFTLRDATRAAHDRLDTLLGAHDLADRDSYGRFLLAQARAFLPVEEALQAAGADRLIPGWSGQRRSMALIADLDALGLGCPDAKPALLFADDAAMIGALYVIEGSRLGAATLLPTVPMTFPRAFLSPARTGLWREVVATIERMLHSDVMLSSAVGSALATFDCFERAARKEAVCE